MKNMELKEWSQGKIQHLTLSHAMFVTRLLFYVPYFHITLAAMLYPMHMELTYKFVVCFGYVDAVNISIDIT